MINKRSLIFLLSIFLLLNQVYVNATTRDYAPRNIDIMKSEIHKEFGYKGIAKLIAIGINAYNENYEKFKNVAKDYNIDLFICDGAINDACLDVARTLKKPVVGFSSFFRSNYKFFI